MISPFLYPSLIILQPLFILPVFGNNSLTHAHAILFFPFSLPFLFIYLSPSFRLPRHTIQVKIMIYLNWAASDDVESQRKGITSIVWPGSTSTAGDDSSGLKLNRIIFMKRIYESLPIRTCSIHICLPDTPVHHAIRSVLILSMAPFRQRLKFHVGKLSQSGWLLSFLLFIIIDSFWLFFFFTQLSLKLVYSFFNLLNFIAVIII